MRKKKNQNEKFHLNIKSALFIADSYKRSGDRAYEKYYGITGPELQAEKNSAVCVTISCYAFAIEVYLKTINYCLNKTNLDGHDLKKLWNNTPQIVQDWLNKNFELNFKSTVKNWNVLVFVGELPHDQTVEIKGKMPDNSAEGMIKGHRLAFEVGRYGYELPQKLKIKSFPFCLPGINLLTQLTRGLAYHMYNENQKLINANKGKKGKIEGVVNFPKSVEELKFPDLS